MRPTRPKFRIGDRVLIKGLNTYEMTGKILEMDEHPFQGNWLKIYHDGIGALAPETFWTDERYVFKIGNSQRKTGGRER